MGSVRPNADARTVPTVAEVREYRRAARTLLRDDSLRHPARVNALMRLYRRARREQSAWAVRAIVAEVGWNIDKAFTFDVGHGEPLERRHRQLRSIGYASCPECWSPLSNELDWATWRALREAASAEFEAREGAPFQR